MVTAFLEIGEVDPYILDSDMASALHIAAHHVNDEIVEILIRQGLDIEGRFKGTTFSIGGTTASDSKIEGLELNPDKTPGLPFFIDGQEGLTPLHIAAIQGHSPTIVTLLENGADINALSETMTSLHLACMGSNKDAAEVLVDSRADIGALATKNSYLQQPIHFTAMNPHTEDID